MVSHNRSQTYTRFLVIMILAAAMLLLLFFSLSWAAQAAEERSVDGGAVSSGKSAYEIDAANNISSTISGEQDAEAFISGDGTAAGDAPSRDLSPQTVATSTYQLFTGVALNPVGTNNNVYQILDTGVFEPES